MKRFLVLLALGLPLLCQAGDYQSTLLVQTGQLRESDLIVRTISDLESNRICLAFYVRTMGTSPSMTCYDVVSGFRSRVDQIGHFKEGKLVVRKLKDFVNNVSCLVAYVSTEGTSPAIDCYTTPAGAAFRGSDSLVPSGHLREGDLDVYRIVDPDSAKSCMVAYVDTGRTSPSLLCYGGQANAGQGGLAQTSNLREGDLIVRKIIDEDNRKECLITYVSTEGTSPFIHCADERAPAAGTAAPSTAATSSTTTAPSSSPWQSHTPTR
jgi:hypothetical protein